MEENWAAILAKDELNRELAAGRALYGFSALTPNFSPTFKRKRKMCIVQQKEEKLMESYNIRDYYDPKRIPSFTDRILYKSLPAFKNDLVVLNDFKSSEYTDSSDHKPVFAHFSISTRDAFRDILIPRGAVKDYKRIMKSAGDAKLVMNNANYMKVVLSELKATNLSEMDLQVFGGKSDPYIIASIDPPEILVPRKSKLRTSIIYHELNPEWKESLEIVLWTNDRDGLRANSHIMLTVWDWDRASAHDLIGTCVLPIAALFSVSQTNPLFYFYFAR